MASAEYELLGPVTKVQIHTDRMVNGGVYNSHLIQAADELWLGAEGVVGVCGPTATLHAHHRLHPNKSRSENPKQFLPGRLLSFGFSGHHRLVCERFGPVPVGIAAEDVIVDCDRKVELAELEHGVQVRGNDGTFDLSGAAIAKPCVPFTKFLLNNQEASDDEVAPNRAFLDEGIRGFLFGLADKTEPVRIQPGDEVWRRLSSI